MASWCQASHDRPRDLRHLKRTILGLDELGLSVQQRNPSWPKTLVGLCWSWVRYPVYGNGLSVRRAVSPQVA